MPDHVVTPSVHPSRRSVVAVAAWSVPAVAVAPAAPAYAISGVDPTCVPVSNTISFYETSPSFSTDDAGDPIGGPFLTVESQPSEISLEVTAEHPQEQQDYWADGGYDVNFACRSLGDTDDRWATTLHRPAQDNAPRLVRMDEAPVERGDLPYSTYTFHFSETVTDVRFTLAGLSGGDMGHDVVRVSDDARPDGDIESQETSVTFDPATGEFWGRTDLWGDEPQTEAEGQVDVYVPGPLLRFTLEVWRAPYGDTRYRPSVQQVFVSDITFSTDCISVPD